MEQWRMQFQAGLKNGIVKGWRSFIWIMKIVLPISFVTSLLVWSGFLTHLEFILRPVMGLLSLPPMAALPILIGMLVNIYSAIAVMAALPLSPGEMTLIAIFTLTAHNMIQEGIIQARSGIHPVTASLFRIGAATLTVMAVAPFLDVGKTSPALTNISAGEITPFLSMLKDWISATFFLSIKIFFIVMIILILLEILKALNWIDSIVRFFSPLLGLMGLERKVGMLWMTAVIFGLSYGGAVIVEEAKSGGLTRKDLTTLHLSIGINHSMLEDPALFLSFGLNLFWLYIPRLLMAIAAVWLIRIWYAAGRPLSRAS
jgi:hypothetical protein